MPGVLPIFPLAGALLLPRQQLPLNVFEPRYLNMVLDALGNGRMIGMIQVDPEAEEEDPPKVYPVGCAGRITAFNETEDGRLLINLTGVCRFVIREELQIVRGYRRVAPNWQTFAADLAAPGEFELDMEHFESVMQAYFAAKQLEVKWDALKRLAPRCIVDFLSANLPLSVDEKQLLLEAEDPCSRSSLLVSVADFAVRAASDARQTRH